MNKKVEIYSTANCPYCVRAKHLLDRKGVDYLEIRIDQDEEKYQEMLERSGGRRTVPQIFINNFCVGGFDDLRALDQTKQLDKLLLK